jgi:hypothetical protein
MREDRCGEREGKFVWATNSRERALAASLLPPRLVFVLFSPGSGGGSGGDHTTVT